MKAIKKGFILLIICLHIISCEDKVTKKQQEKPKAGRFTKSTTRKQLKRINKKAKNRTSSVTSKKKLTGKERRRLKRAARKFKREQRRRQRALAKKNR